MRELKTTDMTAEERVLSWLYLRQLRIRRTDAPGRSRRDVGPRAPGLSGAFLVPGCDCAPARAKERTMPRIAVHVIIVVMVAQLAISLPAIGRAQDTSTVASGAEIPTNPVGEALSWVLTLLNGEAASPTPEEMTVHFAPAFLEAVPPEIMVGLTQQVAAGGPYTLEGFTRPPTANQVNALLIGRSGTPLVLPLSVEAAAPHRITGVNFAPVPPPPGVQLQTVAIDEAPLAEGELRTTETGRLDGLFEVDGRQLYLSCVGTGSPTVVLESGGNDPAAPWFAIERAVAPFTRVCTYDRPNTAGGASDPVPTPVTAQDAVDDLHGLLAAANVPGPYVLVGHSLGGLINRLYASTYPDEVVGLVLIDASHEEQHAQLQALVSSELWQAYQEMMANVLNIEKVDFDASFAQVREARAAAPLRPMPLVVVSAGAAEDPSVIPTFFPPGWPVEVMPQLHQGLQADLATLVPNARLVVAERSGHYVHQGEPELVVEAIQDVVDAVRDPETWIVGTPSARAEIATPAVPGALVDIGGRTLFLSCLGTGSPTVILESGLNDTAAVWSAVQSEVAATTRVCTYDRANVSGGASDPSDPTASTPRLRAAAELVADLHTLLAAAAVPGPYVLVGHSVGGLIVRLYAATYPDEVVGMVLVDATHEDNWVRLEEEIGPDLWPQAVAQFTQAVAAGVLEPLDLETTATQVRDAREERPLHPMPLVVLTHTQPPDPATLLPGLSVEASERRWGEQQADLTTLLSNSQQILAEESGHYIQLDQPNLVIDAIAHVIEAVHDPNRWGAHAAATPTSGVAPASSYDEVLETGIDQGLTGVALMVDRDGEILFDGAAGLANIETQTPLLPTDRFRIYSITKTFTAVLVLQLVDEGVLTLDDTVADWLDDPGVARIPNVEQITVRQLLTHTSGVYDYFAEDSPFWQDAYLGEEADWSRVWTPEELLAYADGASHAPDFAPGEGVRYSNTGYILLGLIVEEATGHDFADRLHQQILDPLGMADTFFAATEPVPGGTAQGYHLFGDELVNVSATHLSAQWTEGGIISTTHDLMRFADALFGGELLQPASLQEMVTFVPSERPGIAWGMGVAQMHTAAGDLVGMGGAGPGFAARMFRQLELDLTVVLLTNTNRDDETVDVLFEQVVQTALERAP
jgi:CubicO group peptidase (beta-lactamase class C family)/pimeloyl-ACP methyl ester carboxylesterase